jgi:diacylglycerol kinase family enzyme
MDGSRKSSGAPESPGARASRLIALLALILPFAAAALIAVALAHSPGIAVLAVALVLIGAAATWLALTSRGATRAVGWLAAGLALAGVVVVLALNWRGTVALVTALVLLALGELSARHALGRSRATAARLGGGVRAPRRTAGRVLIINPRSGGGKASRFDLATEAHARGIKPIVLGPGDDLLQLVEDAIADGAEVVGMAGGDGSQALVATVASRHDVAHVCVPAGTRNHFALDLGLDRDDVVGALDAYDEGVERRIDLARVNDRVFVNNASLGAYAMVVQSDAYRDAKLHTWTDMLPDLVGPGAPPIDLRFTTGDGRSFDDAALVLVSNNPYELTHLAGAGTRERIDTGTLGIVAARIESPADVSRLVALELVGQASRFPGIVSWSAPEFEVSSNGPVAVGLDGEALMMQPPLHFASLPGALRVQVPLDAGVAPAAKAVPLTTASLSELWHVAAGK